MADPKTVLVSAVEVESSLALRSLNNLWVAFGRGETTPADFDFAELHNAGQMAHGLAECIDRLTVLREVWLKVDSLPRNGKS